MKTAAVIFIILGMIINFLTGSVILSIIGLAMGIWALVTLKQNRKSVACGILCLIFTGILGGVFYLCWNENK